MRKANVRDRQNILNLSTGMSGKMDGVLSLSTPCVENPRCQTYRKCKGSICEKCFAHATLKARENVKESLSKNSVLWERELTFFEVLSIANEIVATCTKQFEDYGVKMFRIESFGDIANSIHAWNYIKICSYVYLMDSNINIAWWTKNPNYIETAIKNHDDYNFSFWRENTNVILSSLFIGVTYPQNAREHYESVFGMEVLTFTVFKVDENDSMVNCGARSCRGCKRCYLKENRGTDVVEALK